MGQKIKLWFLLALLILAGVVGYFLWVVSENQSPAKVTDVAVVSQTTSTGQANVGGPFQLIDHTGKPRQDTDFRGQYMMVYFGYSYCPDICPTALAGMTDALNLIGKAADQVQPLFITVDPVRDTVQNLAPYVGNFHPKLIALTGKKAEVDKAAKAYRVYHVRAPDTGGSTDYLIDHSSIIYVMDKRGQFVAHFNHTTEPEVMAKALQKLVT